MRKKPDFYGFFTKNSFSKNGVPLLTFSNKWSQALMLSSLDVSPRHSSDSTAPWSPTGKGVFLDDQHNWSMGSNHVFPWAIWSLSAFVNCPSSQKHGSQKMGSSNSSSLRMFMRGRVFQVQLPCVSMDKMHRDSCPLIRLSIQWHPKRGTQFWWSGKHQVCVSDPQCIP